MRRQQERRSLPDRRIAIKCCVASVSFSNALVAFILNCGYSPGIRFLFSGKGDFLAGASCLLREKPSLVFSDPLDFLLWRT